METLKLVFVTLQDEQIYGWILAVIGASITSLKPVDEDKDLKKPQDVDPFSTLIKMLLGTVFSRFVSHPAVEWSDFLTRILPVVYIAFGLFGYGIFVTIVRFVKVLGGKLISEDTTNHIMDYLKSFITRKSPKKEEDGI